MLRAASSKFPYLAALLRHWFSLVIGIAGGLLGVANEVFAQDPTVAFLPDGGVNIIEHPLAPWTVWVGIFVTGLFAAQYLAWRDCRGERDDLQAELSDLSAKDAPADHIDRLRAAAVGISGTVGGLGHVDMADHLVAALVAHIPSLRAPLETWNHAVTAAVATHRQFGEWLSAALDEAGFVEPLTTDAARQKLEGMYRTEGLKLAREGNDPDARYRFSGVHVFSAGGFVTPTPPWRVEVGTGGFGNESSVASGLDTEDQANLWWLKVQYMLNAVIRSQAMTEIIETERSRDGLKAPLLSELSKVAVSSAFTRVNPACDLCPPTVTVQP